MLYSKKQFGLSLREMLMKGSSWQEVSRWAFKIYIDHGLEFENDLDPFVLKLITMEEGPEFILTKEEQFSLANHLIQPHNNDSSI